MKTLGKIENAILYDLTHPTVNCGKRTSVNTFLDFSTKIFHSATNFAKSFLEKFKAQLL